MTFKIKFYFLFIYLILSNFSFGQNSNLEIIYSTNYIARKNISTNPKTAYLTEKINKSSNELTFLLHYSKENQTSFIVTEELNSELNEEDNLAKRVHSLKYVPMIIILILIPKNPFLKLMMEY